VRVTTEMMPDWALPNSAEEEPVVMEASSKEPVPGMTSETGMRTELAALTL
jgi:hypothetical protein